MKIKFTVAIVAFLSLVANAQSWMWTKVAGGPTIDKITGIATDLTGDIFVTGYFDSTIVFDNVRLVSAGGTDIFVAKYDVDGILLWAKQVGGLNDDYASSISTDVTGNCYITGFFYIQGTVSSFGNTTITQAGDADIFIGKLSSNGDLLWVRNAGGKNEDEAFAIATDIAGNSYITGYFSGVATFGNTKQTSSGYSDIFLVKYDAAGNLVWVKTGGGAYQDEAYGICMDASGNCYITGYFTGNATFSGKQISSIGYFDTDVFIAKYNPSGILLWVKRAGGTGNDMGYGIAISNKDVLYVCGIFHGTNVFGENSLSRISGSNGFIAKFDIDGNLNWSANTVGASASEFRKAATDSHGDCYVIGTLGANSSIEKIQSINKGGKNICIVKYDSKGTLSWVLQGGDSEDEGVCITLGAADNCYAGGQFVNNINLGKSQLSGWGMADIFISKIK